VVAVGVHANGSSQQKWEFSGLGVRLEADDGDVLHLAINNVANNNTMKPVQLLG